MKVERKKFLHYLNKFGLDVGGVMLVLTYNITLGRLSTSWSLPAFLLTIMQSLWYHIGNFYSILRKNYRVRFLTSFFYNLETLSIFFFFLIFFVYPDPQSIAVIAVIFALIHGINLSNVPLIEFEDLDEDYVDVKFLDPSLGKLLSIKPVYFQLTGRSQRVRSLNLAFYQLVNLALLLFYSANLIIPWMNYKFEFVDLIIAIMILVSLFFNIKKVYSRKTVEDE